MSSPGGVRTRDPERRGRILEAALALFAERGFHAVSMAEIGSAAGIVGSGVYRHFESKSAVLLALLDGVMERLLGSAEEAVGSGRPEADVLDELVRGQVSFAVDDAQLLRLYQQEVHTLPDTERRRLRRLQRHYVEEWVHTLHELRPELTDAAARARVHTAIGAIQSAVTWNVGIPREDLQVLLTRCAERCLSA
jgi:AcrR family transcriptional regulator